MSQIIVEGTLQPDGQTLHLAHKLEMKPGPVTVAVQPKNARSGFTMLETLDRIHRDQQSRGRKPMTDADMAAEIARMRADDDDAESRWQQIWSETAAKPQSTDTP